jgi:hypothetical protein
VSHSTDVGCISEETEVKKLLFVCAIGLAALTSASADEPRGSLGLGRMHGWNAGASQSGCGSSWAICRYRRWVRTHSRAEYQARQQRIAAKCTPATVWKDACR